MSRYLPPLSTIIPIEDIPSGLGFFQDGLTSIFSHLYFQDLYVEKTTPGDDVFYSLTIVSYKRLALEVPGTNGLALVLNPGFVDGNTTEFPVSIGYSWGILKYINGFKLSGFDFSPNSFYTILLNISGAENVDLLSGVIDLFFATEEELDPIQKFIDDFNTNNSPPTPLVKSTDPDDLVVIADLLVQMVSNGNNYDILDVIFNQYLSLGDLITNIQDLFSKFIGNFTLDNIKAILIPQFEASLNAIDLALEFPRNVLLPLDTNDEVITDPDVKSKLTFHAGSIGFSSQNGFSFDALSSFDFSKSQIGNTGLTLEFTNAKLDLSRTSNIPEATADGRPDDFIGAFIEEATIGLPAFWTKDGSSTAELKGKNLIIGTGGISGTIGLDTTSGSLFKTSFNGFEISLDSFDITFQQNAIISCNIEGTLNIPALKDAAGNPAEIDVKVSIFENGDFSVTASEANGIDLRFKQGSTEIFKLIINTLKFEKKNNQYALGISGSLDITAAVPGGLASQFLPDKVEIKKLLIYSSGKIEFEGGVSLLPKPISIKLGPAELMISNLTLGSHEQGSRKYLFFGFDGSLNVDPGGVDVRGKGIQFFFTNDNGPFDAYLRIARLDINLIIPGSASKENALAIIQGYLAMRGSGADSTGDTEYRGSISLTLPKPGIKATASMAYTPSKPAFVVDVELSLPVPIPLGPTGLGIYGFRGLLGSRYIATKQAVFPDPAVAETATWWEYYKAPQVGINIDKMLQAPGFSLGAGASIATVGDSGRAFSSKLFFMLSIPNTILLQGQAAIMAQRVDLGDPNDEPPFSAFLGYSDDSITGGFGVNLALPKSNPEVLKVSGAIELGFFFRNASAWYVNIGRDLPVEKRVQGRIFDVFNVYAYLMLSGKGIAAGAGAKFGFDKNFLGIVHVKLEAQLDVGGKITFNPQQVGGFIYVGGSIEISVWKFGLGISASIYLGADAPKPFLLIGKMHVEFRVKLLFLKKTFSFDIELKWERNQGQTQKDPLKILRQSEVGSEASVKALNITTLEPYALSFRSDGSLPVPSSWSDLNDPAFVIPLDSYIDIKFARSVRPDLNNARLKRITTLAAPSDHTEVYPPQKGSSPQVTHDFRLDDLQIKYFDPGTGAWEDYDIYAALPVSDFLQNLPGTTNPPIQPQDLLIGSWQASEVPGSYTNMRLLGINPFSFMNQTDGPKETNLIENFGFSSTMLFCNQTLRSKTCLTWNPQTTGQIYTYNDWIFDRKLWLKVEIPNAQLPQNLIVEERTSYPVAGITKALAALQTTPQSPVRVDVKFPEPVAQYTIRYMVEPCSDDLPAEATSVNFIGQNEVVTIGDKDEYHSGDAFTYELWIKPDANPAYDPAHPENTYVGLIRKYIDDVSFVNKSIQVHLTKGAIGGGLYNLHFSCITELHSQNKLMQVKSYFTVADEWLHLCITSNGSASGDLHIQINGVEGSNIQTSFTPTTFTPQDHLTLISLGYDHYKGSIDSFRMYARALTANEMMAQYRGGRCYTQPSTVNMLGWWKMDETSGFFAADSFTLHNRASLENFSGNRIALGGGAWLNDSCSDCGDGGVLSFEHPFERLVIPQHPAYQFSNDFTIEAWLYVDNNPDYNFETPWYQSNSFILKAKDTSPAVPAGSDPEMPFEIHISKGDLNNGLYEHFLIINVIDQVDPQKFYYMSARFILPDEWFHFVLRKKGPRIHDWEFLVNGELTIVRYDSDDNTTQITHLDSAGPIVIGNLYGDFFGKIDMMRLFNRALTDAEIVNSYFSGRCHIPDISAGLVGYWPLNELEGDTAEEITANNNNGTLVGFDPYRLDINGGAWQLEPCSGCRDSSVLSFDASYERLVIPSLPAYDLSNDFTLETWAYIATNPDYEFDTPWRLGSSFILKAAHAAPPPPPDFIHDFPPFKIHSNKGDLGNGLFEHIFVLNVEDQTNPGTPATRYFMSATFTLPDDWFHLVLRKKGPRVTDWEFLVNGQLTTLRYDSDPAGSIVLTNLNSDGPFMVGSLYGGFLGKVDMMRLFNRALTDQEINDSYHRGRCLPLEISSGLVGYWPLDELEGELAPDISAAANYGVLVGFDPSRTHRGGGAWQESGCSCLQTLIFNGSESDTRESATLVINAAMPWFKVSILEICWETVETRSFNIQQTAINNNRQLTLASLAYGMQNVVQPIWRPNTYFAIQVSGTDFVDGVTTTPQKVSYGFKTEGPVGHFIQHRPSSESNPGAIDSQKLSSLKPYIDYLHSYPNADGNIINAKPLYYKQGENDLLLFFTFPAVYNMFRDWPALGGLPAITSALNILIVESVDQSSPTLPQNWIQDTQSSVQADAQVLNNLAVNSLGEGVNCDQFTFNFQQNYHQRITPPDLKPLTLYSAVVNANLQGDQFEVHRYVFQTSRYGNFSTQISSYLLSATEKAIYTNSFAPFNLTNAAAILNGTLPATDLLLRDFAHPFDRLIRGALRLDALPAAVTTEFMILKDSGSGKTIGILVRNPEPFNDPKLPDAVRQSSITAVDSAPTNLTGLFSKDCSQVFFSNSLLNLPAGNVSFSFQQKIYDGTAYINLHSPVSITITL